MSKRRRTVASQLKSDPADRRRAETRARRRHGDRLRPVDGPLLPPDRVSAIDAAIGRIVPAGVPGHNRLLRAVRCVVADVTVACTLVGDAFGALAGDGEAAERFIDAIELLRERPRPDAPNHAEAPDRSELDLEALERWSEALAEAGRGLPHHQRDHAIPDDRLVPAFVAAAYIGSTIPGRGDRYVGLLHQSLGRLDMLDAVWRSARDTLAGDERAASLLRALLDRISADFRLDDAPLGPWGEPKPAPPAAGLPAWPPPPGLDPRKFLERIPGQELRRLVCLVASRIVFKKPKTPEVPLASVTYHVASLNPAGGCAGTLITIAGTGFGSTPGMVAFPGAAPVAPESWSDTQITARVPTGAICGAVRPVIHERTEFVCGEGFDIYRAGSVAMQFDGSAPAILALTLSGAVRMWQSQTRAEPGVTLTAAWKVCGMQGTTAQFRVYSGTNVLRDLPAAPLTGTEPFTLPSFAATTDVTFEISATNACVAAPIVSRAVVTVTKVPDLTIEGIEVTQGLQHYNSAQHLTDPSDVQPTNSLTLVQDKETWVRVYVRSGQDPAFDGGAVDRVAALLNVTRITGTGSVGLGGPSSENLSVTAQASPAYRTTRGDIARTINFRLPASWCRDTLQLTAILNWAQFVEERDGTNNTATVTADFTTRRVLRLRGIWVNYDFTDANGVRTQLPAPGMADLMGQASWLLRAFPISDVTYASAGTTTLTQPLNDAATQAGDCSPNWNTLLAAVAQEVAADGNSPSAVYVGLVPQGVPIAGGGCGGGAIAVTTTAQPLTLGHLVTLTHEVGHALGLGHAPCGDNNPDPGYPLYEPYDAPTAPGAVAANASIGEFGLDIDDGTIHDPQTVTDVMSYCAPFWISLYHYQKLLNAPRLSPVFVFPAAGSVLGPAAASGVASTPRDGEHSHSDHAHGRDDLAIREHVYVSGLIGGDRPVLNPMHRARGFPVRPESVRTPYRIALADEGGGVLADAAITLNARYEGFASGDDRAHPSFFFASVRYVAGGRQVVLLRGREVVHRVAAPQGVPRLRVSKLEDINPRRRTLRLTWEATHPDGLPLTYWVRYSSDGGETWHPLAVDLTATSFDVDLRSVPGGPRRLLQVAAHDGFNSVYREVGPLDVPFWPPAAIIITPRDGDVVQSGATLLLHGEGFSAQDGSLPAEALRWTSDREGELGVGKRVPVRLRASVRHQVTLTVTDARGTSREASVSVTLAAKERPRDK